MVNVLTAGDDKVCPRCEDIADSGPYTIDEARGLIPAHPSCRCAFDPVEDDSYTGDAYNPNQPRVPAGSTEGGQWISEGGGKYTGSDLDERAEDPRYPLANTFLPQAASVKVSDLTDFSFGRHTNEEVDPRVLKTPQDYLYPGRVKQYLLPKSEQPWGMATDYPSVIDVEGEKVIINGSHRVAAALVRGQEKITVSNYGSYEKVDGKLKRRILQKDEFDPNQPRDDRGRWTKTGAGTHAMAAIASNDPPLPRQRVEETAQAMADLYGFEGHVIIKEGLGREFTVGGRTFVGAANANYRDGTITIYRDAMRSDEIVEGTMAHEIMHHTYAGFVDVAQIEGREYRAEIDRRALNRAPLWALSDFNNNVAKEKWPVYFAHRKYINLVDELARTGDVSNYSSAYWRDYHRNPNTQTRYYAMSETLAEKARLRHKYGRPVTPNLWDKFLDEVEKYGRP